MSVGRDESQMRLAIGLLAVLFEGLEWEEERSSGVWCTVVAVPDPLAHELVTENLRRLTEAAGIPLTVVADRAGIDRRELFAMMAGEYDADLDWLNRLAEGLGVPLTELFIEPEPK